MEKLYKVLDNGHAAFHGGQGEWTLLKWMPPIEGELIECRNGYHLCRREDLVHWIGPEIHEASYRGERVDSGNKIVVREARTIRQLKTWNEKTARMFAVDCAERMMHLGDEVILSTVLAISWLYAAGETTSEELAAAWAAARAAAGDAAGDAAWAAAWDAARAAAWAAAWAAWDAARAAASGWQTERLFEYLYP